jgi:hypothetical protein
MCNPEYKTNIINSFMELQDKLSLSCGLKCLKTTSILNSKLIYACKCGHIDKAKKYFQKGAKANSTETKNKSLILYYLENSPDPVDIPFVEYLFEKGANMPTEDSDSLLLAAIPRSDELTMLLIVKYGVSVGIAPLRRLVALGIMHI